MRKVFSRNPKKQTWTEGRSRHSISAKRGDGVPYQSDSTHKNEDLAAPHETSPYSQKHHTGDGQRGEKKITLVSCQGGDCKKLKSKTLAPHSPADTDEKLRPRSRIRKTRVPSNKKLSNGTEQVKNVKEAGRNSKSDENLCKVQGGERGRTRVY